MQATKDIHFLRCVSNQPSFSFFIFLAKILFLQKFIALKMCLRIKKRSIIKPRVKPTSVNNLKSPKFKTQRVMKYIKKKITPRKKSTKCFKNFLLNFDFIVLNKSSMRA